MGLMNFIKSAGDKIFGKAHASESDSLKDHIKNLGGENVAIDFKDGIVNASGKANSQEEKEKILLALGNVEGVEKVEDHIEVSGANGSSHFYTVKKGDNLSKIAKEFYHDANKWKIVFEANKPMLSDPDKIYPGQVLRIPEQK